MNAPAPRPLLWNAAVVAMFILGACTAADTPREGGGRTEAAAQDPPAVNAPPPVPSCCKDTALALNNAGVRSVGELEERAAAGDRDAQSSLEVLLSFGPEDVSQRAAAGYLPAMRLHARRPSGRGEAVEYRQMLEARVRAGDYGALYELAVCLKVVQCGVVARAEVLTYVWLARAAAKKNRLSPSDPHVRRRLDFLKGAEAELRREVAKGAASKSIARARKLVRGLPSMRLDPQLTPFRTY
jgi:hypothetical protein